jgi:hypothetical protein
VSVRVSLNYLFSIFTKTFPLMGPLHFNVVRVSFR